MLWVLRVAVAVWLVLSVAVAVWLVLSVAVAVWLVLSVAVGAECGGASAVELVDA